MSDAKCEGCGATATAADPDGVPLCAACAKSSDDDYADAVKGIDVPDFVEDYVETYRDVCRRDPDRGGGHRERGKAADALRDAIRRAIYDAEQGVRAALPATPATQLVLNGKPIREGDTFTLDGKTYAFGEVPATPAPAPTDDVAVRCEIAKRVYLALGGEPANVETGNSLFQTVKNAVFDDLFIAPPAPKPDEKCPGCGRDADFVETFHGAKSCYHPFHDAKPDATGVDRVEILPLVTADLAARIAKGAQQYGEPLTSHNGRDALQDAYEEALDLSCYLKQAIVERAARDGSK